ncbi:HIT family protein [Halobacillus shinanisalinarum]|uniref:HIT family protein n=1 Tax=Halobacillus shinanisalinarum TaxID=2932258 RepID=A0ABY4GXM6_9BACI|nr:HIT family protein [Halobacillus shinanisalinarum]UOQ92465.1 HIT family protein [Halobacillus shinanisalinarum]
MAMENTCPFCQLTNDAEQQIIFENETCYFIQKESEQSVLEGSGLIIPKIHTKTVFDLSAKQWTDSQEMLKKAKDRLDELHSPDGYSVGWNTGETGGQSIPHAHLHVIPRYQDEPYAGKGIRYWIKQFGNARNLTK